MSDPIDPAVVSDAQRIIGGPAFEYTIAYLKAAAVTELVSSEPAEKERRELLYMRLRSLDDVRVTLRNLAQMVEKED